MFTLNQYDLQTGFSISTRFFLVTLYSSQYETGTIPPVGVSHRAIGISRHNETIKAFGLRLRAFISFTVFGYPDEARSKHEFLMYYLKADLDGTTFAYDCRMRFLERALLASCKTSHTTLVIQYCLYFRLS